MSRQYETLQDKTRQHKTNQGKPIHDITITRQRNAIQYKTIPGETIQNHIRQDKTIT